MTSTIIKSVSRTLDRAFGDEFEVYFSKDVQQGLQEPCFIVSLFGSNRVRQIDARYRMANSFVIQYFPKEKRGNIEMVEMGERLFDVLEFVELPNDQLIHGTAMNYSIQDGVLHFFIDYNVFLIRESDLDEMETFEMTTRTT